MYLNQFFHSCFPLKANHLDFSFTSVCWILRGDKDFRKGHVSKDLSEKILGMLGNPCIPGSEKVPLKAAGTRAWTERLCPGCSGLINRQRDCQSCLKRGGSGSFEKIHH